ncbi:hypothetical protein [Haliangium sp.]|uniref:hypothetical protein n=1 Tax=Haliangium sp. TaxID=2663208 RepID=UPI003D0D3B86
MKPTSDTISLWNLVESMQRGLERLGLDADSVDLAVTRRLKARVAKVGLGREPDLVAFET